MVQQCGWLVAALCLTPILGWGAPAVTVPEAAYTMPQQMVEVQPGRRLNLYCLGQGTPTVLLDAGAGGGILDWRRVQGEISKTTRTCAYDRAGHGHSDPLTTFADVASTVDDIDRLIGAAKLDKPLVYVGHSIAGLYGVYLQGKYPGNVAAEVLVDPSFAHRSEAMAPPGKRADYARIMTKFLEDSELCLTLALAGRLVHPADKVTKNCVDPTGYPGLEDAGVRSELDRQNLDVGIWNAGTMELAPAVGSSQNTDDQEMDSLKPNFGNKPLHILSAGTADLLPDLTPGDSAYAHAVWVAVHDRLAALSAHGSNTVVPGSGHYIQLEKPKAVIETVRSTIEEVRKSKSERCDDYWSQFLAGTKSTASELPTLRHLERKIGNAMGVSLLARDPWPKPFGDAAEGEPRKIRNDGWGGARRDRVGERDVDVRDRLRPGPAGCGVGVGK